MRHMNTLKALVADCREQGENAIADGIAALADDITELCEAVKEERAASDSGDSIAYLGARLRTTAALMEFTAMPSGPAAKEHE